jgi:hypothetical protein
MSYNKEQAEGDDRYNIITIVMHERGLDVDGAIEWAREYHEGVQQKFLGLLDK